MDVKNLYDIDYIIDDIVNSLGFDYGPSWCTPSQIDHYYKICTTYNEVERFNFHRDYWGDADYYQECNLDFFEEMEGWLSIGEEVIIDSDTNEIGIYKGIAIDRQYNSISHTRVIVEPVE